MIRQRNHRNSVGLSGIADLVTRSDLFTRLRPFRSLGPCSRQGFVIGYALHSGRRTGELSHTANCSIRLLTQMLNTLQEATAMAKTFRARCGRSSLGRGARLKDVGASIKRRSVMLAILTGALLLAFTHTPVARLDAPDAFAIKDVQIVTGAGKTIAKGTVVFRKGLITDVGESVKIPADARVI